MSIASSIPSRVIVLGDTGFVGGALAGALRRDGLSVVGVSSRVVDLGRPDAHERLRAVCDRDTVVVVAAAARGELDTAAAFDDNVAIAITVGRLLETTALRQCVYLSTASVYGDATSDLAVHEGSVPAPTSYYGVAKLTGEHLLRRTGTTLTIVRPCRIYGPGDAAARYGPSAFARAVAAGRPVRLYGDGKELRDHVYVDDAVRVVARLIAGGVAGTYNLATGQSHAYQEIVDILRAVAPGRFEVVRAERTRPRIDQGFDVARLRAALPGLAFVDLAEGLRRTYAWAASSR